jgi:hypothetical protein
MNTATLATMMRRADPAISRHTGTLVPNQPHVSAPCRHMRAASQADPAADAPQVNVLDLALRLIELYIDLSPEQRMPDAALSHLRTFLSQSAQAQRRRQRS